MAREKVKHEYIWIIPYLEKWDKPYILSNVKIKRFWASFIRMVITSVLMAACYFIEEKHTLILASIIAPIVRLIPLMFEYILFTKFKKENWFLITLNIVSVAVEIWLSVHLFIIMVMRGDDKNQENFSILTTIAITAYFLWGSTRGGGCLMLIPSSALCISWGCYTWNLLKIPCLIMYGSWPIIEGNSRDPVCIYWNLPVANREDGDNEAMIERTEETKYHPECENKFLGNR